MTSDVLTAGDTLLCPSACGLLKPRMKNSGSFPRKVKNNPFPVLKCPFWKMSAKRKYLRSSDMVIWLKSSASRLTQSVESFSEGPSRGKLTLQTTKLRVEELNLEFNVRQLISTMVVCWVTIDRGFPWPRIILDLQLFPLSNFIESNSVFPKKHKKR